MILGHADTQVVAAVQKQAAIEYGIMYHLFNLESVNTYEGTTICTRWFWDRHSPASRHSS